MLKFWKNFSLIKYDLSEDKLIQLLRNQKYFPNRGLAEKVYQLFHRKIYSEQVKAINTSKMLVFLLRHLTPVLPSKERSDILNVYQLKRMLDESGDADLQNPQNQELIIKGLTNEYNQGDLEKIVDITTILKVFLTLILLNVFFMYSGFGERIRQLTEALNPASGNIYLFQTCLGLTFTLVGFVAFLSGTVWIPFQKLIQYKVNDVSSKGRQFRENFLHTVPTQIMNLGIITMIFAIVGIVFFDRNQLLDMNVYFHWQLYDVFHVFDPYRFLDFPLWGFSTLSFLVVAGGFTEAAAFFLGYKFPEKFKTQEDRKELKIDANFADQLAVALKKHEVIAKDVDAEMIAEGVLQALKKVNIG